jgi:hypothetical protein
MRGTGLSIGLPNIQAPGQFGAGLDPAVDTEALLATRDLFRNCPACSSQEFADRRVRRKRPASADASRALLI